MNSQTGLTRFVNQTQMASFSSFVGEIRWTFVVFILTLVCAWLLTRESETMRATGLAVAGLVGTTLLGKTVAGVVTNKNVRETSREYVEAKAKVEANGTPAVHADRIEHLEVQAEHPVPLTSTAAEEPNIFRDDERG